MSVVKLVPHERLNTFEETLKNIFAACPEQEDYLNAKSHFKYHQQYS